RASGESLGELFAGHSAELTGPSEGVAVDWCACHSTPSCSAFGLLSQSTGERVRPGRRIVVWPRCSVDLLGVFLVDPVRALPQRAQLPVLGFVLLRMHTLTRVVY